MANHREQCKEVSAIPHMKCTFDRHVQEFRITYDNRFIRKDRAEQVACYTGDFDDALGTARDMSRRQTERVGSGVHDDQCGVWQAIPCNCAMAAFSR